MVKDNKKVYIVNFWHGINYGATLTAYALFKLVSNLNYDAYLLDNRLPDNIIRDIYFYPRKFIKKYFKYQKFKKEEDAILISGSDQVFNPNCASDFHDDNMLNFALLNNKKISVAASFGVDKEKFLAQNSEAQIENMKNSLKSFDYISVREQSGVDICSDVFGVEAKCIPDPVIIFDNWEELIKNSDEDFRTDFEKNKIVSYIFGKTDEHLKVYNYLSDKYKTGVLDLEDYKTSPENWLYAIKNCDLFVTNSFHGLCFAILFKKNFIVLIKENESPARFDALFNLLGIKNQCVFLKQIYEKDCVFEVNYEETERKIKEARERGYEFLLKSLKEEPPLSEERQSAKEIVRENYLKKLKEKRNLRSKFKKVYHYFRLLMLNFILPEIVTPMFNSKKKGK